jgi:hypothetical protein
MRVVNEVFICICLCPVNKERERALRSASASVPATGFLARVHMYKHSPIDMSRRVPISQMQESPLSETAEDAAVGGCVNVFAESNDPSRYSHWNRHGESRVSNHQWLLHGSHDCFRCLGLVGEACSDSHKHHCYRLGKVWASDVFSSVTEYSGLPTLLTEYPVGFPRVLLESSSVSSP